ncbi:MULTISPECIES: hypothetical protein [Dysgonomonas]|uniref:hypothetical protein n=1 Tax=Dysgonomonas TaxID=156973 RepID=UPI000928F9E3|nr:MULTISPECIES: hypothetical protein [Dysgonomonas]MBN9302527.1 hypothetical protein [Dysgonomonas mossii]OJX59492.1 MAG: hypothetical protein BGO84_12125 [Dysgonomonas sp. 37-18]
MKNLNKGKLIIEMGKDNKTNVIFRPVNGTVWMDKNELCELFGVYMPEIKVCIGSIMEKKIVHTENTYRFHRVVKGSSIVYDIREVNMEVIIALSFHLRSAQAYFLREWFMERILKQEELLSSFLTTDYTFSLN